MGRFCYEYYGILNSRTSMSEEIARMVCEKTFKYIGTEVEYRWLNPGKTSVEFFSYFTDYTFVEYFEFFETLFLNLKQFFPYKFKLSSCAYMDKIIPRGDTDNMHDIYVKSGFSEKKRRRIYSRNL